MNVENKPQLGQIVKVLRGRDQGKFAIIVGIVDSRFVLIADGDKRKFDQPKKKNLIHLQLLDAKSREVADSLHESGRVTNGKLRYALSKFVDAQAAEAQEKGE
jgi:ribosomal protein L14E/L6E/L27E